MTEILTVAIPTVNRATQLEQRLRELSAQYNGEFRILISDNGSTDGTREMVENWRRRIPYIDYYRFESNEGFDNNVLNCFLRATTEYVWLNSDNYAIEPDAAGRLIQALRRYTPSVATAGVLSPEGASSAITPVDRIYRSSADMSDYRPLFRAFCVTGIVLKRRSIDLSRLKHARGTWYMQLALCQELLSRDFVYAVLDTVHVARRTVNRRTTRPYLEFWLTGPLKALKTEGVAFSYQGIQDVMATVWRDYLVVLLAAKAGLYSVNPRLDLRICRDAWRLLGWRSIFYFTAHVVTGLTPTSLVKAAYRLKLIWHHGTVRGNTLFQERTALAARQTTFSSY